MKKIAFVSAVSIIGLFVALAAFATVSVNAGPASLVIDPILAPASSGQIGLFEVTLSEDAGETLSSVAVTVNDNGSSGVTGADLASVSVYKDDGNGTFESGSDLLAGSESTVNVGAATTVTTGSNNGIDGGKFFVSIATSASWSDAVPADSITVTLAANGVVTSANSPSVTETTTNTITADTTDPSLSTAEAKNTGGTTSAEAGDSIDLTFSEPTNKFDVDASNITTVLSLNDGHSFLDGEGMLGGASWNESGTILSLTLSASTSFPTVVPGDTVTVVGDDIQDLAGNVALGSQLITGDFTTEVDDDDDGEGDEDTHATRCGNNLSNGRLYKVGDNPTVYLAAACRLKPFRGAAVFHARGHKFQNIIMLDSLDGINVSDKPVLPSSGTLIKGSDATVWFVTKEGKRRGFRTSAKFFALGFSFDQVETISNQDLNLTDVASPIEENESHPDGALIKCSNSAAVFQIIGKAKFPFSNAESFLNRGHSWLHIAHVECGRFAYINGSAIDD